MAIVFFAISAIFKKSAVLGRFSGAGFRRSICRYPFYVELFELEFTVFSCLRKKFTVSVKLCDKWL